VLSMSTSDKVQPAPMPPVDIPGPATSYLLVCDEWSPTRGGVSMFNRALATALARNGHRTACLVESATANEHDDARTRGVTLLTAEMTPAGPALLVPATAALDFSADVIIGHDRFSGREAWAYARRYGWAALVLIIHTAPNEIERYRNSGEATRRMEQREEIICRIAADADITAAVGPRLSRYAADLLEDGSGRSRILQLDPGVEAWNGWTRQPPRTPHVLVLGRTGDIELKGLDIAARAVAQLPAVAGVQPRLLVRGAPDADCDALHAELVARSGVARERIDVRSFTVDPIRLQRELARSAVCVMPSRVEGFGLAAFDAIAAGTPVLISSKSGAAELLRTRLGRSAEPMIVEMVDNRDVDVPRWGAAIATALSDVPGSFRYAQEMRTRLAAEFPWHATAEVLDRAVVTGCDVVPR
jgi:glycosyltransferase involved in cell wall biosynthesis